MSRDLSHWLIEDEFDNQGDWPLPEEEGFHNEPNPEEFEPDYEALVP